MKLKNGGILGPENIPSTTSASGMWTLADATEYIKEDLWPRAVGGLYLFTTATFTNGDQEGREGPSLTQARNGLSGPEVDDWKNDTEFFNTSDGIQLWTVPRDGTYRVTAFGAQGGGTVDRGGRGAIILGDFNLATGEVIQILVGQMGFPTNNRHSSGGGGTFIVKNTENTPSTSDILVIAGGGGGSRNQANTPFSWMHGVSGPDGEDAQNLGGSGGINGNGATGSSSEGAGGAGHSRGLAIR